MQRPAPARAHPAHVSGHGLGRTTSLVTSAFLATQGGAVVRISTSPPFTAVVTSSDSHVFYAVHSDVNWFQF